MAHSVAGEFRAPGPRSRGPFSFSDLAGESMRLPARISTRAESSRAPMVALTSSGHPDPDDSIGTERESPVDPSPAAAGGEPGDLEPGTWTVRPGDKLWDIAEQTLEEAWGRPASDEEIAAYWQDVVALNRSEGRISSGDPDLIHAGEQMLLPPPPPDPQADPAASTSSAEAESSAAAESD